VRPRGWTPAPGAGSDLSRGLCAECSAALAAATSAFLAGDQLQATSLEVAVEAPPSATVQPSPLRYFAPPNASSIPIAAPVGPTRVGVSNVIKAAPATVRPTPVGGQARSTVTTASMAVDRSKVSSNPVVVAKIGPATVANMEQRGLVSVAPAPGAVEPTEFATQSMGEVETGEAQPIPALVEQSEQVLRRG
jgi:hypothetical protein